MLTPQANGTRGSINVILYSSPPSQGFQSINECLLRSSMRFDFMCCNYFVYFVDFDIFLIQCYDYFSVFHTFFVCLLLIIFINFFCFYEAVVFLKLFFEILFRQHDLIFCEVSSSKVKYMTFSNFLYHDFKLPSNFHEFCDNFCG